MDQTVKRVLNGDKAAFLEIVQEFGPAVRAYFSGRVNDPGTVDDLTQETFIATYETLAKYRSQELGAWIFGIARNRLRLHYRRVATHRRAIAKVRLDVFETYANPHDDTLEVRRENVAKLRLCIEKLPERSATILKGRYFDRLSVIEIAEKLGTTVSGISSNLHRVRGQLRLCMRGAAE